ncbi:MAG: tetratricopeptide repeat protein [Candidatus Heimdallarchaeota archaeon]
MNNEQPPPDQPVDRVSESLESDETEQELLHKLRKEQKALQERMKALDKELRKVRKERRHTQLPTPEKDVEDVQSSFEVHIEQVAEGLEHKIENYVSNILDSVTDSVKGALNGLFSFGDRVEAKKRRKSEIIAQQESFQQAERFFQQGKFQEALERLDQLDTLEDDPEIKQLQGQLLKCRIYALLDIKKAQDIANQVIKSRQDLNLPLIRADALLVIAEAWLELGKLKASRNFLDQIKAVLATITNTSTSAVTEREATVLALEGGLYTYQGPIERAVEYLQQSLTLREQLGNPQEVAHSLSYLGIAYRHTEEFEHALGVLQQSLSLREQLNNPQAIAHSLFYLGRTYYQKGEHDRSVEFLQKSLAIRTQLGTPYGIAECLAWLGSVYMLQGEWNHALEIFRKSLMICEQLGIPGTFAEARSFLNIGRIHTLKGEWEPTLENLQKSLALEEARGYKEQIGYILSYFSVVYQQKGQLEAALEYLKKSLKAYEEAGPDSLAGFTLTGLVQVFIELGNLEAARRYVQRLEEFSKKAPSKFAEIRYNIAQALLLKASPRTRDKMRALDLYKQIVEDEVIDILGTARASFNLCELLFFEFKTSEDPVILHEIQKVTNRLLDLAEVQHSHLYLTETYFLQAKLALLELDVPRARRLFNQAQAIAEEKGLEKLAQSISSEHDALLAQLNTWETLKAHEAPLVKARELSDVEELLTRLVRQRAVEPPKLQPEEPLLLMVLTESGISIFTKKFELGQQLDDQLIGGLLTAINAFGKDVFSEEEGVDRVMYHGYTVVVKPLNSMLICYMFKGYSYLALQKLEQFVEGVQASSEIWETLSTGTKTDAALKAVEVSGTVAEPGLHQLITEIFLLESN